MPCRSKGAQPAGTADRNMVVQLEGAASAPAPAPALAAGGGTAFRYRARQQQQQQQEAQDGNVAQAEGPASDAAIGQQDGEHRSAFTATGARGQPPPSPAHGELVKPCRWCPLLQCVLIFVMLLAQYLAAKAANDALFLLTYTIFLHILQRGPVGDGRRCVCRTTCTEWRQGSNASRRHSGTRTQRVSGTMVGERSRR